MAKVDGPDIGTGLTAVLGTAPIVFQILDVSGSGIERPAIDVSHMATTGYREKLAGDLVDAGSVDIEVLFDPGSSFEPPIDAVAETFTITFPKKGAEGTAATLAGTGFCTNWNWGVPLEDKMTATWTWTWDGYTGPTFTDAS